MDQGIDVYRLKPGNKITIKTCNSIYVMKLLQEKGEVLVEGGVFDEKTQAYFSGSTFGFSTIKIGYIDFGMCLEFYLKIKNKTITTSPVKSAFIEGDNYVYKMDWKEF